MAEQFIPGAEQGQEQPSTPLSPSPDQSTSSQGQSSEPLYDVTINGRVEKVPLGELLKGYSRTQDYTQKTQRLAAERQQKDQQLQEYETALREVHGFLQDPQRVYAYAKSMGLSNQQAAGMAENAAQGNDPMQLLTRAEAQEMIQNLLNQATPNLVGASQQQIAQLRLEMATREYQNIFDQKIAQLQESHPELKQLGSRGAQMIRMEALAQRPQTVESAIEALELAAESLVGDFSNILKREATSPLRNGIEPPGGQGILPAPSQPFKNVKDPNLRAQVIQDLMAAGRDK